MIEKALKIPYMFVTLNWAAVMGLVYYLNGRRDVWQVRASSSGRRPSADAARS